MIRKRNETMNNFIPKFQSRYNENIKKPEFTNSHLDFYSKEKYSFTAYEESLISYESKIDPEFAVLRWHEQLETIYVGEYDELPNVEDWYIDTDNSLKENL